MSTIRRQSIISSFVIYIGFAIGLLNVYFFTTRFNEDQYGLTSIFVAIATMMSVISMVAMPSFIFKFYHYYNDNLPPKKNDMITWALIVSLVGFLLVLLAGWFFKGLVIRKFGEHSPLLVTYYNWIFPMGLGLSLYLVLEAYAWNVGKPVLTSFFREVQWRLLTTVLILLFVTGVIRDYDIFIKLYAFTYPGIAVTLFIYLVWTKKIHFTFQISKVSRRFFKSITRFVMIFYSGAIIFTISQVFDTIVIASKLENGTAMAGIFGLAQIMASVIQAPQRGIIAASISHLSRAWKEKNMVTLQRIYQRSSINQLVFALGLFMLIALNYTEAVRTIPLRESYLLGFNAFLLLGMMRLVDMGTGVNSQIIGTSNYWKFELISGVILISVMLPLTYVFTIKYGLIGPAIANLISIAVYNLIRILFLWKKFKLFPFTIKTVYTLILASVCSAACYFIFLQVHGFPGLILRSITFIVLYASGAVMLKLSPDIQPVLQTVARKLGIKRFS